MPSYVIAGASRGIGLEFVKQLLSKGNVVFALARNPDTAEELTALKTEKLTILKADTTDPASLTAAAEETAKVSGGAVDVLINNAAYQDMKHMFHGIDEFQSPEILVKDFNDCWTTNVLGPILTTNAFLPLLKKGTLKKVITLSTGMGDPAAAKKSGYTGSTAYSVSKSALEMVTVKYASRYKDEGFTFLSISPGVVQTSKTPPPPEVMPKLMEMITTFKKNYPHWQGPLTPTASVEMMLKVIDEADPEKNGEFLSHLGNRQWL